MSRGMPQGCCRGRFVRRHAVLAGWCEWSVGSWLRSQPTGREAAGEMIVAQLDVHPDEALTVSAAARRGDPGRRCGRRGDGRLGEGTTAAWPAPLPVRPLSVKLEECRECVVQRLLWVVAGPGGPLVAADQHEDVGVEGPLLPGTSRVVGSDTSVAQHGFVVGLVVALCPADVGEPGVF